MECGQIKYSGHAIRRMFERKITESDVLYIISSGQVIIEYTNDTPYPSYLILGFIKNQPLHVLIGSDIDTKSCYVITTYIPNSETWNDDYKTRRILP